MPLLDTTPYRVFYLINCPENTPDFKSFWGIDVDRTNDSRTNKYTTIVATMEIPNDFYSVVVRVMDVTEYVSFTDDSSIELERIDYKEYPPMPWNDMDERIVELINKSYDNAEDNGVNRRKRQIDYADSIQALIESPDSIKVSVDKNGCPKVEITGLPYLYGAAKHGNGANIRIVSNRYLSDYTYTIDTDSYCYEPIEFDGKELHRYISQSKKYAEVRSTIEKLFDFNYYDTDDDWDD